MSWAPFTCPGCGLPRSECNTPEHCARYATDHGPATGPRTLADLEYCPSCGASEMGCAMFGRCRSRVTSDNPDADQGPTTDQERCPGCGEPADDCLTPWLCSRDTNTIDPTLAPRDPNGRDAHEPGAKLDGGKLQPDLILSGFARALTAVAEIGTHGAEKYTRDGWAAVPDGAYRYRNAGQRHALARATGEYRDPDSGLPHIAHEAWNKLAELELALRKENDDTERAP